MRGIVGSISLAALAVVCSCTAGGAGPDGGNCGYPLRSDQITLEEDHHIEQAVDAGLSRLRVGDLKATQSSTDRLRKSSTQIFNSVGESGENRALEMTEFRVCKMLEGDKSLPTDKKAQILLDARDRIRATRDAVVRDRKVASQQECIDKKTAERKTASLKTFRREDHIDIDGPGVPGGRRYRRARLCVTTDPGYTNVISARAIKISGGYGGRWRITPIEQSLNDGRVNACVNLLAWSSNSPFGGGGGLGARLEVTAQREMSQEDDEVVKRLCPLL